MKKAIIALMALAVLSVTPAYASEKDSLGEIAAELPDEAASVSAEASLRVDNSLSWMDIGTISVEGRGSVSVMPDIAILTIGAMTSGETVAVQQENAAAMEKVIAALKESGVAESDIATESYSLYPEYNYEIMRADGTNEISGYTATHMLKVTVRDLDKTGTVISNATAAGANQNWGMSFDISDKDKHYNEALAKAMKDAENKAKIIAGSIGVSISKPSSINEYNSGYMDPYMYQRSINYDMSAISMAAGEAAMAAPVSAGEMEITASVSLSYQY